MGRSGRALRRSCADAEGPTVPGDANAVPPETVEIVLAESVVRPTLGARRLLEQLEERKVVLSASGVQKIQRKVIQPPTSPTSTPWLTASPDSRTATTHRRPRFDWRFSTADLTAMLERVGTSARYEAALAPEQRRSAKMAADEGHADLDQGQPRHTPQHPRPSRWPSLVGIDVRFRANFATSTDVARTEPHSS